MASVVTETSWPMDMTADETWKREQYSIVAPVLAILGMCAVLVNVYVLLSGLYLKRSASINLWFSLSLAAVDTYSATLIVINLFLQSYLPFVVRLEPHRCALIVAEMLRLGGLFSSVLHLLALAFTHFLGVLYPLRQHSMIAARKRRVTILVLLWLVPVTALLISMSAVPGEAFLSSGCRNLTFASQFPFRATVSTFVAIPMLCTFAFYFAILWQLRENDRDPVLREARPTRHNKKLFMTMILLMGTFLMGWLPTLLMYLLYCEDCPLKPVHFHIRTVTAVAVFVQILIILKLFLNPIIYALRIGELRVALCKLNKRLFGVELFAPHRQYTSTSMQMQQFRSSRPSQTTGNDDNGGSSSANKHPVEAITLEKQKMLA